VLIQGFADVEAIAAGSGYSMAVRGPYHRVYGWGANPHGQLGIGNAIDQYQPRQSLLARRVVAISAGWFHSLALTSDGRVASWGSNAYGQLGVDLGAGVEDRHTPDLVPGLEGIRAVAAGGYFSLALGNDGFVWAWGYNEAGQLGDDTTVSRWKPRKVKLSKVIAIAAGGFHALAVVHGGKVAAWGSNDSGQLGDGSTTNRPVPVRVENLDEVG